MSVLERGYETVRGAVNRGWNLALAIRGYTEMGLHYGGIYRRLLGSKQPGPIEEVKPMKLGSLHDRSKKGK